MILMYKLIIGAVVSVVGLGATYFAAKLPKGSPAQEVAQKVEDVVEKVVERRQRSIVVTPKGAEPVAVVVKNDPQ